MATKKKEETETNESVFDSLIEAEFTEMQDLSKVDNSVEYWVDTGNYALNYAISKKFKGGYPGGRITNLFGLSGTGKSMLPAIASRAKQWNNIDLYQFDRIIVVDSEGGGSGKSLFEFVDAPLERVRYINISTLDSYRTDKKTGKSEAVADKEVPTKLDTPNYKYTRGLIAFLKKIVYAMKYNNSKEKLLIIIDSISNIKSFRTVVENGEDMGKTNKLLNNFFALDTDLHEIGATVMLASKVYTNLNNPYDPWVLAGGQSVVYNPSLSVKLTTMADSDELSAEDIKAEKERRKTALGNSMKVIRATVAKSRFGTENRNVWFMLDATYGIVRNSGLFGLLYDFGAIKKNGSRYELPGVIEGSFFKKDFAKLFAEHEEEYIEKLQPLMDEIEENIKRQRISVNVSDMSEYNEGEGSEEDTSSMSADEAARQLLKEMEAEEEM